MAQKNHRTFVLLASIPSDEDDFSKTLDRQLGAAAVKDCVAFVGSHHDRLIAVCDTAVLSLVRSTYQTIGFPEDHITLIPHNGNPRTDMEELAAIERARRRSVNECLVVMGDEHTQTRVTALRATFPALDVCAFTPTGGAAATLPKIICKEGFAERAALDSPNFVFTMRHFFG